MAVEAGVRAAKEMEHPVVGTGHLLLGILDDIGASWIPLAAALGVTRVTVNAEVAALGLSESSSESDVDAISGNGNNANNGSKNGSYVTPEPHSVEVLRREVAQLRLRLELLESQVS
jgi:Clp amino terminal domain, pathogenicity island component